MNKIEICKKVLEEKQSQKITVQDKSGKNKKVLLDLFTASKIVNVYNQVKESTQKNMELARWEALLNIAYKY